MLDVFALGAELLFKALKVMIMTLRQSRQIKTITLAKQLGKRIPCILRRQRLARNNGVIRTDAIKHLPHANMSIGIVQSGVFLQTYDLALRKTGVLTKELQEYCRDWALVSWS